MTQEEINEVLNDLILINNDRIAGYEKAAAEAKEVETDLRAMFNKFAEDSRKIVLDLSAEVTKLGGEPATGTMASGKLYRVWMDIRSALSVDNRAAVLANAEAGEDAALKAYAESLGEESLPADLRQMILSQQQSIQSAHETIKKQRDEQKEVGNYPLTS